MNDKATSIMSLADCLKAADETKELILEKNALEQLPALLRDYYSCDAVFLVADENTYMAAGKRAVQILTEQGITLHDTYIFSGSPQLHAEYTHVKTLASCFSALPENTVPVVFGGGTLNDLVKRASHERELPYCCVPTAASVDGFTAFGAALLKDGLKQTLSCPAPRALAADTEVLAKAPAYLSSSGFGDLASKIIAATDWIIADKAATLDAPGAEPISEKPWAMVQNGLMAALDRSIDAARGDVDAVSTLFATLAITGFSMQYHKNSRPVSGAEHLFSHVWEMNDLTLNGVSVTHGHKVAIGTLAATAFTELFFADPDGPPPVTSGYKRPSRDELEAEVRRAFHNHPGLVSVTKTATDKLMTEKQAQALNELFRDTWKDIRERVLAKLVPYSELKEMLGKALCPLTPESIGLSRSEAIATARLAQMIRVRYSILDLAWDMGNFEETLSRLEASPQYLR